MIRDPSKHIEKQAEQVRILRMETEHHEIIGIPYRITRADVLNTKGTGYYRTILYEEPGKTRSFSTCLCDGFQFKGNCKHIAAVFAASRPTEDDKS